MGISFISIILGTRRHHLTAFFQDNPGRPLPEGQTVLDFTEVEMKIGWQCQQLDHMQVICTLLQTDNHTQHLITQFDTRRMLFLMPNQKCQSTLELT